MINIDTLFDDANKDVLAQMEANSDTLLAKISNSILSKNTSPSSPTAPLSKSMPVYHSPFGDGSLFDQYKYFSSIVFQTLLDDIKNTVKNNSQQFQYDPSKYQVYFSQYLPTYPQLPTDLSNLSDDIQFVQNLIQTMASTPSIILSPPATSDPSYYYDSDLKQWFSYTGELCDKAGIVAIDQTGCANFVLDVKQQEIQYSVFFFYYQDNSGLQAINIHTDDFDDYAELYNVMNLGISNDEKNDIIKGFNDAIKTTDPDTIAWLFDNMPDLVFNQFTKQQLATSLQTLLTGSVTEGTLTDNVDREAIVLKILNAFTTVVDTKDKKEEEIEEEMKDSANILLGILRQKPNKDDDTYFELLYDKLNVGTDNWKAAILILFKMWYVSIYNDESKYTYQGTDIVPYQSTKILGFYNSGYSFTFDGNNINALKRTSTSVPTEVGTAQSITEEETTYDIFQPINLPSVEQDGSLQLDFTIPAFYLKAFDDANAWDNFDKATWIAVDVVSTLTLVGNLAKLRYLYYLGEGVSALEVTLGFVQVTTSVLNLMLEFVNNSDTPFCKKLRTYLFWLDIAAIGTDVLTSQMLRKTAEDALDAAAKDNSVPTAIREHLEGVEGKILLSTIGGEPMDSQLLKKIIASFERQGKTIDIGEDAQKYIAIREEAEGTKIEGITFNENIIILDPKASTSAVYEELIHATQYRVGKYSQWVEEYGNDIALDLMEKDAAEQLIKNAITWKIPENEIELIKERLDIFTNKLKRVGL
jgi:hypothetical protein